MEAKDWITITSIASTFFIALLTIVLNHRREMRQEIQRKQEREHEHQLKLKEKEFELRYSKLHEKRVQTLSELYERLASVNKQIDSIALLLEMVQDSIVINNLAEKANNEYQDCLLFFAKNRLYFSKELAELIDKVLSEINLFSNKVFMDLALKEYETLKHTLAEWQEKRVIIADILKNIESEFREMLGSDSNMSKSG
jgi:hypothetical protein